MNKLALILVVLLAAVTIEALLATRVWAQVTAQPLDDPDILNLFEITDDLAGPFQVITGEKPVRETGVFDFTVLVAIEGYFIAMLGLVAVIYLGSRIGSLIPRRRRRPVPPFVTAQMHPEEAPQLWQPVSTPRLPGATIYVPQKRRDTRPRHAKASLG